MKMLFLIWILTGCISTPYVSSVEEHIHIQGDVMKVCLVSENRLMLWKIEKRKRNYYRLRPLFEKDVKSGEIDISGKVAYYRYYEDIKHEMAFKYKLFKK